MRSQIFYSTLVVTIAVTIVVTMSKLREMESPNRSITWLLVAAVLTAMVFPAHFHLRHVETARSHTHKVDVHLAGDKANPGDHEDATAFPVTPDTLVKQFNDHPFAKLVIVFVLLLLPPIGARVIRRNYPEITFHRTTYYSLCPPLRAPPRR